MPIVRNDKRLSKYLTDSKLKMSAVYIFEIKGTKVNKLFKFLKGAFLRNGLPSGYDFWFAFRDFSEASKKYHFEIFLKI